VRTPQIAERLNFEGLPQALIVLGVALSVATISEVVATILVPAEFTLIQIINLLTTFPFLIVLVGGGYRLSQGDLQTSLYPRIAGWTTAGFVFLTGFFSIIALGEAGLLVRVQMVLWGAAVGSGGGALLGLLEARAIDRALAAERTQIRNEELKRQNDRLEEFASILSHDLRNPLNVASGHIELLREEYDDESFDRIAAAHDRMEQIIEETLILARSGQVIDEPEAVSLADLVSQCWANVETDEATLELVDTAMIVADGNRLQHLFENLFRNAVEHGRANVTIRVGILSDGTGFYVEDDGPGITTNDREAVLESGYSTKEGGTGIGLAIVKQIVDVHGWDLHLAEGIDGGARFEVTGVGFEASQEAESASPIATTGH